MSSPNEPEILYKNKYGECVQYLSHSLTLLVWVRAGKRLGISQRIYPLTREQALEQLPTWKAFL